MTVLDVLNRFWMDEMLEDRKIVAEPCDQETYEYFCNEVTALP